MYKRVLLKLSGEALKNNKQNSIIDIDYLNLLGTTIKELTEDGYQIAIVIGAGNIWRGQLASSVGLDRLKADYMGMLGTVINAVTLSSALQNLGLETAVFSALGDIEQTTINYDKNLANQALNDGKVVFLAGGTGKPFFTTDTAAALRALELNCEAILMGKNGVDGIYSGNPLTDKNAKFIKDINYDKILEMKLEVMDASAVELIKNEDIDIRVFSMADLSNFKKVIEGEDIGTTCHRKGK